MKLLTSLSLASAAALGSTLATDYTADRSLRGERTITTTSELVDMVMIVDGEEMEGRGFGGGANERTLTITTVDKVLEHEDGAPTRVRRTIETLGSEGVVSMRGEERDIEQTSDAEGAVLELGFAENGDLEVEVVEGSEPEGADFASLELGLELDALLPAEAVEAGGTWDLESDALVQGLGMGLEAAMFGRPSQGGGERGGRGEGGGRGGRRGRRRPRWLQPPAMAGLEWEGEATLTEETETVDDLEGLVIELEVRPTASCPSVSGAAVAAGAAAGSSSRHRPAPSSPRRPSRSSWRGACSGPPPRTVPWPSSSGRLRPADGAQHVPGRPGDGDELHHRGLRRDRGLGRSRVSPVPITQNPATLIP